jgi:uncharacterized membrane protein YeaQ/YmgE (transglycosylase-associated protein family)
LSERWPEPLRAALTFSKRGFGLWVNMGVGMLGALVGGVIFRLLHIDLGLGEIKITFEDLISAFVGSVFLIIAWRLIRKNAGHQGGAQIRRMKI